MTCPWTRRRPRELMSLRPRHAVAVVGLTGVLLGCRIGRPFPDAGRPNSRLSDEAFWAIVVGFSEPEREFRSSGAVRTDNLVSNERSFQQVVPMLQDGSHRGAYLGVGPEQNFTYI